MTTNTVSAELKLFSTCNSMGLPHGERTHLTLPPSADTPGILAGSVMLK